MFEFLSNLASDRPALAAQQGQLFAGSIQTKEQGGDDADEVPIRAATGRGGLSAAADQSFLTGTQEGKHQPVFSGWKANLQQLPSFLLAGAFGFWGH